MGEMLKQVPLRGVPLRLRASQRRASDGQRAMAYAWIYPEATKLKRRKTEIAKFGDQVTGIRDFPGVTTQRVAEARLVIERCPDLIDAVNLARLAEGRASRH